MAENLRATITAVLADGRNRDIRCPVHGDHRSSLSVGRGDDGKVLLKCHVGCEARAIVEAAGLTMTDLFPPRPATTKRTIVAIYPYHDEQGTHLFDVVRFDPKDFQQRRPDGAGGFVWKTKGVRKVLFGLPELQGQKVVHIAEGEEDVKTLRRLGLVATCNPGGASESINDPKWKDDYSQQLVAAGVESVTIYPDNDEPGRAHADAIARSCLAAGIAVKVVTLPDLTRKGADVSDWITAGHTRDELLALVNSTPLYPSTHTTTTGTGTEHPAAPDLADLLTRIYTWVRRFIVVSDAQAVVVALWVVHTHAIEAAECTPYLQVTSATARTGKTRVLEVIEYVVARPWFTGRATAAALVRKIDQDRPTLLLDESDAAFQGDKDYAEALRGVLNSGYRASGKATVCIGQGTNIQARDFRTFCPKAIAGIGDLPGTIADRSIKIELRRRTAAEPCERWRERDGRREARPIADALALWATPAVIDGLREARPELPAALNDRATDVWEPLFAIAELAGGDWSVRVKQAALTLSGALEDRDINIELLHDIHEVFEAEQATFLASKVLVEQLAAMDDRPWADWRQGKPITPRAVADRLKPFGIFAVPNKTATARGYYRDRFEDVWSRYPPIKPSSRQNSNETGPESPISNRQAPEPPDTLKTQKTSTNTGLFDDLTLQTPDLRDRRVLAPDPAPDPAAGTHVVDVVTPSAPDETIPNPPNWEDIA